HSAGPRAEERIVPPSFLSPHQSCACTGVVSYTHGQRFLSLCLETPIHHADAQKSKTERNTEDRQDTEERRILGSLPPSARAVGDIKQNHLSELSVLRGKFCLSPCLRDEKGSELEFTCVQLSAQARSPQASGVGEVRRPHPFSYGRSRADPAAIGR